MSYIDRYHADTLPVPEDCVVFGAGDSVSFTVVGLRRYQERFRRAGFDIARITTRAKLLAALEGSYPVEESELLKGLKAKPKHPERDLLIATLCGDTARAQRLKEYVLRKRVLRAVSS